MNKLETQLCLGKSTQSVKNCLTETKKHLPASTMFPNKNLKQIGQGVHELWSDISTLLIN